jgi:magnesium-transporting ATPase (P-type)
VTLSPDAARSTPGAVSRAGLTGAEAAARRPPGGNRLPVEGPPSPLRLLAAQLVHVFALLLWGAAALAFVGGMPQLAVAIVVIVLLNGVFAFVQEFRADRAAEALRDLVPHRVTVVRDGLRQDIDAGEPTGKAPGDLVAAGCFITEGEASATVVAIGADTRLASIATLTRSVERAKTPLARELDRVVRIAAPSCWRATTRWCAAWSRSRPSVRRRSSAPTRREP